MADKIFLACSRCHTMIVKSINGEIKIRTKVLLLSEEEGTRAICGGCGVEVPLPIKLDTEVVKSLAKEGSPSLYLKNFEWDK